jgi:hypothetical protein
MIAAVPFGPLLRPPTEPLNDRSITVQRGPYTCVLDPMPDCLLLDRRAPSAMIRTARRARLPRVL